MDDIYVNYYLIFYTDIPYFLYCLTLVPGVKVILSRRRKLKFINITQLGEKVFLLLINVGMILYMGICLFDFFENTITINRRVTNEEQRLSLIDLAYYMVITVSTVGYGDIVPRTSAGQVCIMFIIFFALLIVPGHVSELQETLTIEKSGDGQYSAGKENYVIICARLNHPSEVSIALDFILQHDRYENLHIVLLARKVVTREVKELLSKAKYLGRVTYLVGNGMEISCLRRSGLGNASAAFIMASSVAKNSRCEDEQNTLRAWSMDEFSPATPLYVETLSSETKEILQKTCSGVICLEEFKQIFLASNCLYRGIATLVINLINHIPVFSKFDMPWQCQYGINRLKIGDGASNLLFEVDINHLFIGTTFTSLSFYLFKEFQVNLIGINRNIKGEEYKVILNPGFYRLDPNDKLFIIATSDEDIKLISKLSAAEYELSLDNHSVIPENIISSNGFKNPMAFYGLQKSKSYSVLISDFEHKKALGAYIYDYPPIQLDCSPLWMCILLPEASKIENVLVDPENHNEFHNHIIVCTESYELSYFLATLRSSNITAKEFRTVVILCSKIPTNEEYRLLSRFPEVYIFIGDARKRTHLELCGIALADKIIITNMTTNLNKKSGDDEENEGFEDGPAIMVAHLIFNMFHRDGIRKTTIVDLGKRSNIKFLRPTSRSFNKVKCNKRENLDIDCLQSAYYTPIFAAGNVLCTSMLDNLLLKLYFQPNILEVIRCLCGTHHRPTSEDYPSSSICSIEVPPDYVGRSYLKLYELLTRYVGIVPLGILRDEVDNRLGNR